MSKSPTSTPEKSQSSDPPKKKLRKKLPAQMTAPVASTRTTPGILVDRIEVVAIDSIQPFPGNPRRGNVPALAESLRRNGQYRPLVVQKSTRYILGGNHTWQGAKAGNWPEIAVTFIDVTDEQAARIVLVDNRTSDLAGYDPELLADILNAIPDPNIGTGYSSEDIAAISRSVASTEPLDLSSILHPVNAIIKETEDDRLPTRSFDDADADDGELAEGEVEEPQEDLFKSAAEFDDSTAINLKDQVTFSSSSPWGIPDILKDMTVDKLPSPLDTWAGSATADDPRDDIWWFYNYGIDSTTGMKDPQKIILAFYANDEWFENWWKTPGRMMTKAMNAGIEYAVMPNFSQWNSEPKTINLWALYRSRWLGRYFQEIGIKVIPDINWILNDREWLDDFVLPGIPTDLPYISMELQTYAKDQETAIGKDIRHIVKVLEPETLLLYAGFPGRDFVQGLNLSCKVRWIPNRLIRLGKFQAKKKKDRENEKTRIK